MKGLKTLAFAATFISVWSCTPKGEPGPVHEPEDPKPMTVVDTCCLAKDYKIHPETVEYWRVSWAQANLPNQPYDPALLPSTDRIRAVASADMQQYLHEGDSIEGKTATAVRIYLNKNAGEAGLAPDLVFIPVDTCRDYSMTGKKFLLYSDATGQNPGITRRDFQSQASTWLNGPLNSRDYNVPVYAYTFERSTITSLLDNDSIYFEMVYRTADRVTARDKASGLRGDMIIDLLAHDTNPLGRGVQATSYDFANPCPLVCDTLSSFYQYYK